MKPKNHLLAAALLGGVLAASTSAAGVVLDPLLTENEFTAPAPALVVAPSNIPRHYQNETIRVRLTVDEQGRARDVELVDGRDPRLVRHLLPAVAQWQFKPARQQGRPVAAAVVLPVRLVESADF